MRDRKTYFVLRTSDYDVTHIKLGQIVTDMRLPYRALSPPFTPVPQLSKAFKENYRFDHSKAIAGSLGIQAQILVQLGAPFGADVSGTREKDTIATWKIDRLETEFIEPPQKYVEDSVLKVPVVKNYLDEKKLTGSVYMVTGIKIAKGVSFTSRSKESRSVQIGATIDATAFSGAPASGGPYGKVTTKSDVGESWTGCSDFVFAYRVQKISISWRYGTVKSHEKVGGDLAGLDDDDEIDLDAIEDEVLEPQDISTVTLQPDGYEVPAEFIKAPSGGEVGAVDEDELLIEKGLVQG